MAIGLPVDRQPNLESGVPPERVAQAILAVLREPRKSVYVPGYFRVAPFLALALGGLLDRLARPLAWVQLRGVEKARRGGSESRWSSRTPPFRATIPSNKRLWTEVQE